MSDEQPETDAEKQKKKSNATEWTLAIVVLTLGLVTLAGAF